MVRALHRFVMARWAVVRRQRRLKISHPNRESGTMLKSRRRHKKSSSPTLGGSSRPGSNLSPVSQESLAKLLPSGFQNYFQVARYGKWWGLRIECPVCGESAPKWLVYTARKWRWLSIHMLEHGAEEDNG